MKKLSRRLIIYLSCEILVAIIAILGNALVALIFLRDRRLRTPTNLYVFSLAVVNLLTSIVAIPVYLHSMINQWPHEFTACLYVNTLIMTFCTVSIFHLVAVSFDRYMGVVWSHKPNSHRHGMVHAIILIILAWILGIIVGVLPLMGWNGGRPSKGDVERCEFMKVMDIAYLQFVFYATVLTPSIILLFFYLSIYCTIRRHSDRLLSVHEALDSRMSMRKKKTKLGTREDMELETIENSIAAEAQQRDIKKMKKVINSLFLVIVFFHICWYPLHIMNVIVYYKPDNFFENWHFYAPIVLSHASNAINPFIYGLTMPKYKEAFVEALACNKPIIDESSSVKRKRTKFPDHIYDEYFQ